MKVVIAGGTGALGRRLADEFVRRGDDPVILTRSARDDVAHRQVRWDGRTVGEWASELEGALLVNLAGELVDRRPTRRNIELLQRSRVEPTRALVQATAQLRTPPTAWLQMSTLAIYGDAGERIIDEDCPVATGPPQMAGVATAWEHALEGGKAGRVVILRTGIVLAPETPAFDRLVTLTRYGLGGRIGTGRQWVSWLHITDFCGAVRFVTDRTELDGVVHVTSPSPVRNRDMMSTLRSALRRPWSPPTPRPLVRVGASLMGSDPALALMGRRCVPAALMAAGFEFDHPTFPDAVSDLLHETR